MVLSLYQPLVYVIYIMRYSVSNQVLAEMVGTTRPRINMFMNRFRKKGFIDYDGGLEVHQSLRKVLRRR